MKLTREKALELHRKMWSDMRKELGDNPTVADRTIFKMNWCEKWCEENGFEDVINDCFFDIVFHFVHYNHRDSSFHYFQIFL